MSRLPIRDGSAADHLRGGRQRAAYAKGWDARVEYIDVLRGVGPDNGTDEELEEDAVMRLDEDVR